MPGASDGGNGKRWQGGNGVQLRCTDAAYRSDTRPVPTMEGGRRRGTARGMTTANRVMGMKRRMAGDCSRAITGIAPTV